MKYKLQLEALARWYSIRIDINFLGAGKQCSLKSNTEGGKICLALTVFWQVIPTWQKEIRNSALP